MIAVYDVWDSMYAWVPWPISATGMVPAIVLVVVVAAISWSVAWAFAYPVLKADDRAYNELSTEHAEALNQIALLTQIEETT